VRGALPEDGNIVSLRNKAIFRILCFNQAVVAVEKSVAWQSEKKCRIQIYSYMITILKQEIGTKFVVVVVVKLWWIRFGAQAA
jgi:hypothetical protein